MRKLYSFLFCSLISLSLFAQQSGKITYTIEMNAKDPEMQQAMQMMGGNVDMQVVTYYSKDGYRSEMTNPFMSTTTISSTSSDEVLVLMDGMMGKSAIKTEAVEYKSSKGLADKNGESVDITFTDETKEILGYTCKKAYLDSGSDNDMIFWFTEEIKPDRLSPDMPGGLPGIPLEYSMNSEQMDMIYKVTDISFEAVDASKFDTKIPAGFKEMDLKALEKMGGMMGF